MNFQKKPISYAISYALLVALTPVQAATIGQVDVSSEAGDLLVLDNDHVAFTGTGAAIRVKGEQNGFTGSAMDIRATAAGPNDAVTGLQVLAGGQGSLQGSTIQASGYFGDGASASGEGSHLRLEQTDITTDGSRGRGVMVDAGASAALTGGSVTTTGLMADAVSAIGAGSTISVTDTRLSSAGNAAFTVKAQQGARIDLSNASATSHGQSAVFNLTGVDTVISADGVTAQSDLAQGVDMQEGLLQFSNGSIIAKTDGILIRPSSPIGGGRAQVHNSQIISQSGNGINLDAHDAALELSDSHVTTQGNYGSAIWMPGSDTQADVRNSVLETWGTQAAGVDNRAGSFRMDGGRVVTHGDSSHGLYASTDTIGSQAGGPSATFDVKNVVIETFGNVAVGAFAMLAGTRISLADSQILTHGASSYGLYATTDFIAGQEVSPNTTIDVQSVAIETFGEGSVGALARLNGAQITLADSRVLTHGDLSHGLLATGDGAMIQTQRTDVITEGNSAYGLFVSNNAKANVQATHIETLGDKAYGLVSQATGAGVTNQIDLTDSSVLAHHSTALRVSGGSLRTHLTNSRLAGRDAIWISDGANGLAADQVTLDSQQSLIDGNIQVDGGALQLSLQNHSRLQGAVTDVPLASSLSLDDSSTWLMRGNSSIGQLTNNGTVEFAAPTAGGFMRLKLGGDLDGDGRYIMNTDLGALRGDRLEVGGQVTGNNQILVRNSGAEPTSGGQRLTLVESQGGSGDFSLANRGQQVDIGTYRYTLQRDDSSAGDSQWSLVNVGQHLSTAASAAINSSALSTLRDTWDAERGSLIQRLGDVRDAGHRDGVWMRSYGEKQTLDTGAARHFSQRVNGMQLGLDTRLERSHGSAILGGLAGYSHANRDFNGEGSGKLESYYIGTYATYLDDSGWYADSLLTLNRWSTRLDVHATDGDRVSGKTRSSGAGLSFEAGKRVSLEHGWFVEPQAQLSALYGGGDRYRLSNGLRVEADNGVATQLRGGALLGRVLALDNGAVVQPYIKAGWTQDLSARNQVKTNGISSHPDGNGGGWYAGAGVTGSLARGQQVYADVGTSDSATLKRPWALNIGYRLAW